MNVQLSNIETISDYLTNNLFKKPEFSITSGSGFSDIWNKFNILQIIPYSKIPQMPQATVPGHKSELFLIEFNNKIGLVFGGRFHIYEGYPIDTILIPTLVPINLGIKKLIFMNAAGGLNSNFEIGDLMIINDIINFTKRKLPEIFLNDVNYPSNSEIFSKKWIQKVENDLVGSGIKYQKGTYIAVTGPSYETSAEIRMFRRLGGDSIGMSTVLESICGNRLGAEILAFSVITNILKEVSTNKISHVEVIQALEKSKKNVEQIIQSALKFI